MTIPVVVVSQLLGVDLGGLVGGGGGAQPSGQQSSTPEPPPGDFAQVYVRRGFDAGKLAACDTFSASEL
ncbi:MAG TPA: hypothetical protein VK427_05875 [Kofleriaceae bacterium]|nr:hypothetical protein [Kofleriaceae bacterium]